MQGESYIELVRFPKNSLPEIESVINYGASNHEENPHFADQMPLYLAKQTKKMTLDKAQVLKEAVRVYHPK
jgi:acyl-homoserine-lactone acylase